MHYENVAVGNCLFKITIQPASLSQSFCYSFVADNGTIAGCPEKRSFCQSNPCQHGGKCVDGWGTYLCECTEGWSDKDCSQCEYNIIIFNYILV